MKMGTESGGRKAETGGRKLQLHPSSFVLHPCAFSLVEVTLALGIAGFCLIAMLGLIPAGMRNAAAASGQTTTVGILGSIISDLRGTPAWTSVSPGFGIQIPQAGNSATNTIYFSEDGQNMADASSARYAAVATLSAPANSSVVNAQVLIYWPAASAAANASGSIEGVTVLDRF